MSYGVSEQPVNSTYRRRMWSWHTESIEVVVVDQRRRRWSFAEKAALVRRTYEPGMSVSLVARLGWTAVPVAQARTPGCCDRRLRWRGSRVRSELAAARADAARARQENLKEAVEYAAEKSGLHARPCCPGTTSENGLPDNGAGALACARPAWAR